MLAGPPACRGGACTSRKGSSTARWRFAKAICVRSRGMTSLRIAAPLGSMTSAVAYSRPPLPLEVLVKTCPFCVEEVQDAAIVCNHCGRDLAAASELKPPRVQEAVHDTVGLNKPLSTRRSLSLVLVSTGILLTWVSLRAAGVGFILAWIGLGLGLSGGAVIRWGGGFVLSLLLFAVVTLMSGNSSSPSPTPSAAPRLGTGQSSSVDQFQRQFAAGADCSLLFSIRNEAKVRATEAEQREMNEKLRSVQCFSSTSKRAVTTTGDGEFTVSEYRLYRAIIDAPSTVSEAQAVRSAAEENGVAEAMVNRAAEKVMGLLAEHRWHATPAAEIRHASDWKGEDR
jgi:hypothetical protein